MENLSHSVAGLVAGEIVHRSFAPESTPEKNSARHSLLLWTAVLASNFPDLDLFLTRLLPAPLGYLLHHRGHTHTILYAVPQALLLFALTWLLRPKLRELFRESQNTRFAYIATLVTGFSLHLAMDFLNSYGLHPFHPFDSRWYFGDMIFIVEPFFWISLGLPMTLLIEKKWLKGVLLSALLALPIVFASQAYLSWLSVTTLFAVASLHILINFKFARASRALAPFVTAFSLALGFVLVQAVASKAAKSRLQEKLAEVAPHAKFLDASIHSFPTHPFCWNFLTVEKDETAGTYTLRKGLLSLAPKSVRTADCPAGLVRGEKMDATQTEFNFFDQYTGSLAKLRELNKTDCHFEAWLRFVRAPIVLEDRSWDARFSSGARTNFSTLVFSDFKSMACAQLIPGWTPPREDLLRATN